MQAPYDREHGQGAGGGSSPEEQPARPAAAAPQQPSVDPYLAQSYRHDPYAERDPLAQDPGAVARAEVANAEAALERLDDAVMAAGLFILEHDDVVRESADGDGRLVEFESLVALRRFDFEEGHGSLSP
jgi:hypothetical protein